MDYEKHKLLFSEPRLRKYITACNGDKYKGIDLYKYNIQACQALYPILSVLEVALRNSLDRVLSKHYNDTNWLITQRANFAENYFLVYKDKYGRERSDLFFREKLEKADHKLLALGSQINHAKLLG